MADDLVFDVQAMPHAYVSEDAERVEIKFSDASNRTVRLNFRSARFEELLSRAIQIFTHVRNQKHATTGHLGIPAVEAVAVRAIAAAGGGKVLLTLVGSDGLEHHFALPTEHCAKLRPQMRKAEEAAMREASQTRQ